MITAIILAAGKSERMGVGTDKAFLNLGPKPVLAWRLLAFERCADIDDIILVVRKDQILAAKSAVKMFGISKVSKVITGGSRRQDSVANGLAECDLDTRFVVVHDAARPCVTPELVSETVKLARRGGAAIVGHHIWDTVKFVEKGTTVTRTENRAKLWAVQTPQAFDIRVLRRAYEEAAKQKVEVTDDAQAVELIGETVKIYEWRNANIKITTAEDLQLAAAVLKI